MIAAVRKGWWGSAVALFACTHPGPSAAVTVFAVVLALAARHGAWGAALVAAAVLPGQLSIGWGNDLMDADRDRALGRRDKPLATGEVSVSSVRWAIAVSLALCAAVSAVFGPAAAAAHLAGVGFGHAYNLWLKFTPFSVVAYLAAFALLPAFVLLGAGVSPPWWLLAGGGLLGGGAHFTNALPDLEDDARTDVRGLPQRLGPRGSVLAAAVLLGGGGLVAGLGRPGPLAPAATALLAVTLALVAAVAVIGWRRRTRRAFQLTIATAGCSIALLLAGGPLTS